MPKAMMMLSQSSRDSSQLHWGTARASNETMVACVQ